MPLATSDDAMREPITPIGLPVTDRRAMASATTARGPAAPHAVYEKGCDIGERMRFGG